MAIAGATSVALLATACSSGGSGDGESSDGKITLTVSTFNEWGYDDLLDEYMELNPDITVVHDKAATSDEAREKFNTGMASGSGVPSGASTAATTSARVMSRAARPSR